MVSILISLSFHLIQVILVLLEQEVMPERLAIKETEEIQVFMDLLAT